LANASRHTLQLLIVHKIPVKNSVLPERKHRAVSTENI
jgi:hypothetical protein